MVASVIAIINQKGGVGKTTTSANLAGALAELGKRVLIVDMDAQGNATAHLGLAPKEDLSQDTIDIDTSISPTPSTYDLLKGLKPAKDIIVKRSKNLDVMPANLMLSAADLELGGAVGRELLLKRGLTQISNDYDIIVIDCPPALGLLSLNALAAANKVVIPVQSEYLALHGVRQLLDTIDQVREIYNPSLIVGGVLICLHDSRKRLARAVSDTIRTYFGALVFQAVIRTNVSLAEAPASGQTIFEYSGKSTGADDYKQLAEELIKQSSI